MHHVVTLGVLTSSLQPADGAIVSPPDALLPYYDSLCVVLDMCVTPNKIQIHKAKYQERMLIPVCSSKPFIN